MGTPRLSQAMDLFLRAIMAGDNSPRTTETYRDILKRFVEFLESNGCETLAEVEATDIREWLLHKKSQGVSSAHLYNCYRVPRRFWNWCLAEEFVGHDPFARVAKPKVQQSIKQALTDDQIQALLKACEGRHWLMRRDRALILLLLGTGLRIAEAHGLKVADVGGSLILVHGKGGKQRMVPLPPQASLAIRKYLFVCPFKPKDQDPLWWGHAGAITLDGLKQAVRAVGERAGIKLGPHQLRRTYATKLLASGVSMEHVGLLMGHSDYSVLRQYLHLTQADLEQAIQRYNPLGWLR